VVVAEGQGKARQRQKGKGGLRKSGTEQAVAYRKREQALFGERWMIELQQRRPMTMLCRGRRRMHWKPSA